MELLFLGTGAADWSPKYKSGALYRRLSSALVDGDLLIDPGPQIYEFAADCGNPDLYKNVKNVILTHSHGDHLCPESLARLAAESDFTVRFWAHPGAFKKLEDARGLPELRPLTLEVPETIGDYEVVPCPANHGELQVGEVPLNYIVKKGTRSFFYGSDSGWIMYPTYRRIKQYAPNALIFECTIGHAPGDDRIFGHTSAAMIGIMTETIKARHAVADDCKFYATHMARTLHGTQEDSIKLLAPYKVTPAYDGMIITI
ncbi:MAG: MBL fold metallo-hydrolase [Eubacteriales bacterium]